MTRTAFGMRYAVYLVETSGVRFNACFPTFAKAVAEAGWYRRWHYRVVVCEVADTLQKYEMPPSPAAWALSYNF